MGLSRRRIIFAKKEVTYNVDSGPLITADAVLALGDPDFTPLDGDTITDEELRGSLGSRPVVRVGQRARISFQTYLSTPGTPGSLPVWDTLMECCGYEVNEAVGVSQTYTAKETGLDSLTLAFWRDSKLHKMTGARGIVTIDANIKDRIKATWVFEGFYVDPVHDAALDLSTADFSGWTPSLIVRKTNSTVTFDGFNCGAYEFQYQGGQSFFEDENTEDCEYALSDRLSRYRTLIFEPDINIKDYFVEAKTAEQVALVGVFGTVAGDIIEINSTAAQVETVSDTPRQGRDALTIEGGLIEDASTLTSIIVR